MLDDVAWPGGSRSGGRRSSSSATPAGRRALSHRTRRAPAPVTRRSHPPPLRPQGPEGDIALVAVRLHGQGRTPEPLPNLVRP
jgi:hypothetical protein